MKERLLILGSILVAGGMVFYAYSHKKTIVPAAVTPALSGPSPKPVPPAPKTDDKAEAEKFAKAKALAALLHGYEANNYILICDTYPWNASICNAIRDWQKFLLMLGYRKEKGNPIPVKI